MKGTNILVKDKEDVKEVLSRQGYWWELGYIVEDGSSLFLLFFKEVYFNKYFIASMFIVITGIHFQIFIINTT